jgi:hypothetical protein
MAHSNHSRGFSFSQTSFSLITGMLFQKFLQLGGKRTYWGIAVKQRKERLDSFFALFFCWLYFVFAR